MSTENVRILLIEDNPCEAEFVRDVLARLPDRRFLLDAAPTFSDGLARLVENPPDLVLLDLNLPDSNGLTTFECLRQAAPPLPVIILTGLQDEALAALAIRHGAQDYLVKGQVEPNALARSVSNAIERARIQADLRILSLTDELTGLYNRRGFRALVEQELRHAARHRAGYLLLFADVDGLKFINDTFGHAEGDRALTEAAALLRRSFRESDVLARLGGDEFTTFALDVSHRTGAPMLARFHDSLAELNARPGRRFQLSLSLGVVQCDSNSSLSVDQLLGIADQSLYQQKHRQHARPSDSVVRPISLSRSPAARREGRR